MNRMLLACRCPISADTWSVSDLSVYISAAIPSGLRHHACTRPSPVAGALQGSYKAQVTLQDSAGATTGCTCVNACIACADAVQASRWRSPPTSATPMCSGHLSSHTTQHLTHAHAHARTRLMVTEEVACLVQLDDGDDGTEGCAVGYHHQLNAAVRQLVAQVHEPQINPLEDAPVWRECSTDMPRACLTRCTCPSPWCTAARACRASSDVPRTPAQCLSAHQHVRVTACMHRT